MSFYCFSAVDSWIFTLSLVSVWNSSIGQFHFDLALLFHFRVVTSPPELEARSYR